MNAIRTHFPLRIEATNAFLSRRRNTIVLLVCIAITAIAAAYGVRQTFRFTRWLVDDAFIIFRYAENLAEHGELTWNIGEDPVEGYTGITLPVLIALAIKLNIPPVLASHSIGIAAFLAGGILLILILRGFNIGSAAAFILYMTAPFLFAHAWSGLETTLFIAAILFAVYALTLRKDWLFLASLLIVSFTRPEGVLLALILLFIYRPLPKGVLIAYLVPCAIYFVWRWNYYGQLLPNTFYAKHVAGGRIPAINAYKLWVFTRLYLAFPGLLALLFLDPDIIKRNWKPMLGLAAFSGVTIVNYLSFNLIMDFSYRFYAPFYPLALLAVGGILKSNRLGFKLVLVAFAIITIQTQRNIKEFPGEKHYAYTHYRMLREEHIEVGKLLRERIPQEEWIAVHADAGAIPFYAGHRTIDFGRLNDEYLARKRPAPEEASDYFFSFNPAAVSFTSTKGTGVHHGREADAILRDGRFARYELVQRFESNIRPDYYQFLYIRKDLLRSGTTTDR
ncbi:MAG: hypothetical protein JSV33_09330 [bacterium]|nr:MAG: hypothetical protein JSV33_09330 [bacterium]